MARENSQFEIAPWLSNRHAQTLWPQFFHPRLELDLREERLQLEDGDFVDLCWTPANTGPVVILFHGLEGSVDSPYAQGMLGAINALGWRAVLMHFRGCSKELNRLDRNYHSGDVLDVFVVEASAVAGVDHRNAVRVCVEQFVAVEVEFHLGGLF